MLLEDARDIDLVWVLESLGPVLVPAEFHGYVFMTVSANCTDIAEVWRVGISAPALVVVTPVVVAGFWIQLCVSSHHIGTPLPNPSVHL